MLAFGSKSVHVSENAANDLVNAVSFELSEPLEYRLEVPLTVTDGSARQGEHYAVRRRPRVIFEAGATRGRLSGDGEGCDVVIKDDHELYEGAPRSFDLALGTVDGIVDLDSSRATCRVSIDDDEKPPASRIKIRFTSGGREVRESQVAGLSLSVQADGAPDEKAEMNVVVQQMGAKEPTELGRKVLYLEPGQTSLSFLLSDIVPVDRLKAAGLTDDDAPGPPSELMVRLRGQHPLFADEPRDLAFRVADDDPAAKLGMQIEGGDHQQLDRILPESPFWVVAGVDRGVRLATPLQVTLGKGGPTLTGILPPGERSVRIGPLNAASGPERSVDITLQIPANAAARPFVVPPIVSKRLPKGPRDAARFAVVVVNTARLHEPGNGILEAVWKYLKKSEADSFRKGVLIVGPKPPQKVIMGGNLTPSADHFSPLTIEGHGVSAQLKKLVEVVDYVRKENEDSGIRIVVVWPERALESPAALAQLEPVDPRKLGPISFFCPGAGADAGKAILNALVGAGSADVKDQTVRCPDVDELSDHIRWAIDGFQPPGKTK
jgi:hypothetical protein